MYGAVTGKVVLFAVVVILCLLSLTRTIFLMVRSGGEGEGLTVHVIVRLLVPFILIYAVWWLLWG
ncbi:hypothetical protein [Bombella saccharophila]|uniref:Uncharacterized protein n=1 Tax=Bombella saccharophila TaxID=2967338 RepID=A0ABT3W3L2_9PROT|nr:hypothetical protein [Bombella saccharophila]MCX5613645.1 hypothetical protein [Bombella saccharophila]PHI97572.1 hypothetical protein BG621_02155 [Parasaccharibacter apium]